MRLLNTQTGRPEEFIGTNIPPYAILSHTWGEEEVSFKDLTTQPFCESQKGYAKVSMTCQLARADGLQYAWVDTCCIDKTSSAELSEAINSMYQWYKNAEKCYAYLSDLDSTVWQQRLSHCRWFTRGWTLQELIAPADVYFYDRNWNLLFRKSEGIDVLGVITGIDKDVLRGSQSILAISVAQRMSWASRRVTTRIEDEAYCLLGLFEVHMPMLYGEGKKAFLRLQEEIIRICPDLSIFAWRHPKPDTKANDQDEPVASSIFASAVVDFAESGTFAAFNAHSTNDFYVSNQGIKLHTRLAMQEAPNQQGYRYIFPVCKTDDGTILGIQLRKCGSSQLVRQDPTGLIGHDFSFPSMQSRTMYLLIRLPPEHSPKYLLRDIVLHTRAHISRWDAKDQIFFVSDNLDLAYSAAKVSGEFDVGKGSKRVDAHFDFMLYSLRWANTRSRRCLHTVVPWKPSDATLKDLNERLEQYDYTIPMVEDDFKAYKIPISSSAQHNLGDSGYVVTVNCSSHIVSDGSLCHVPFWKLELSWDIKEGLSLEGT